MYQSAISCRQRMVDIHLPIFVQYCKALCKGMGQMHAKQFMYSVTQKKVSHSQESSLNRMKNCRCGYSSLQFWV